MKGKGAVYTIIFITLISAAFAAILAFSNSYFKPFINKNLEERERKEILFVAGVEVQEDNLEEVFNKNIVEENINGRKIHVKIDHDKKPESYIIQFSGAGLWGTISGYIGVEVGLGRLTGVTFTEHNETPGLGARIDEEWFKRQFSGIEIKKGKSLDYEESGIDTITGATSTSRSVMKLINSVLNDIFTEDGIWQER